MKKSILSALLGAAVTGSLVLLPSVPSAQAAASARPIQVEIGGLVRDLGDQPFVYQDRTFVPLRAIFEQIGATLQWDAATSTVTATQGDVTIRLTIGDTTAYRNDAPVTLDAPAMIRGNRVYVPVRFIAESFNTPVEWDADTNTVRLLPYNRYVLQQILEEANRVPFPQTMHVEYTQTTTNTLDGHSITGTKKVSTDLVYQNGDVTSSATTVTRSGDLYTLSNTPRSFEMYTMGHVLYVRYDGWKEWKQDSRDNADALFRSALPLGGLGALHADRLWSRYATLEQTNTAHVITFYGAGDTMLPLSNPFVQSGANGSSTTSDTETYTLDPATLLVSQYHATFRSQVGHTAVLQTVDESFTKLGRTLNIRIPSAAQTAVATDLSTLR